MGLHAHALKSAERTEKNEKGLRLEQKVAGSFLLKIIFFRVQTFWKILNLALYSQNIYILAYHLNKNGTRFTVDLPQVDPEASERLAAKLRGARSTCFACKNIHLIKCLARKLIQSIYADISCLHNKPKLSISAGY